MRTKLTGSAAMSDRSAFRRGFTLTELLVVIGIIILLIGLLLPALAGVHTSGLMSKSMSNMRQIGTWMRLYSSDNREYILPSRFDYSGTSYPGKVRSASGPPLSTPQCGPNCGTWTDILWTVFAVGVFPESPSNPGYDYRFDSPDRTLYDRLGGDLDNPFRSAVDNTQNMPNGDLPTPFGTGAQEKGLPGYFAANDFFDARPDTSPIGTGAMNFVATGPWSGRCTWWIPLPAR
jgi:prepilin-type N-terminal cleavage/methylation domain-containing protein